METIYHFPSAFAMKISGRRPVKSEDGPDKPYPKKTAAA